jgi:hypothetical protein
LPGLATAATLDARQLDDMALDLRFSVPTVLGARHVAIQTIAAAASTLATRLLMLAMARAIGLRADSERMGRDAMRMVLLKEDP